MVGIQGDTGSSPHPQLHPALGFKEILVARDANMQRGHFGIIAVQKWEILYLNKSYTAVVDIETWIGLRLEVVLHVNNKKNNFGIIIQVRWTVVKVFSEKLSPLEKGVKIIIQS